MDNVSNKELTAEWEEAIVVFPYFCLAYKCTHCGCKSELQYDSCPECGAEMGPRMKFDKKQNSLYNIIVEGKETLL